MATEPITVEQAIAAADNAEYLALTVESNNYSETTPNGTVKRTITGMNTDVDGVLATANATISALEQTASNAADAAALSAQEANDTYNDTLTVQNTTEGYRDEAETFKDSASQSSTDSEESAVRSELYSNLSYNTSNYKGAWVDATGAGLLSEVYSHSGNDWQLTEDVADITLSEPSSSDASWRLILGELQQVALSIGTTYYNVMYSTDTASAIVGYIYDAGGQVTYSVPEDAKGKYVQTFVNEILTTSDSSEYTLTKITIYKDTLKNAEDIDTLNSQVFDGSYGLVWNSVTDTYTRVGSSNITQIQDQMKRCVLNTDGSVNYYLHPNDSTLKEDGITPSILDGSDGNVMVEIPKFYVKYTTVNTSKKVEISATPLTGFSLHKAFIKGGVEVNHRYYRAYEGYKSGNTLLSRSGVTPTTNQTIATFRTQAQANGTGWHLTDWNLLSAVKVLLFVEIGTFNSQSVLGEGNSSGGDYGVTTGQSNSIGNSSSGHLNDDTWMSYRGIENFYADVWEFVDGVNVSEREFFVNDNYQTFSSDVFTGDYVSTGVTMPEASADYIKDAFVEGFIPTSIGGSSSTYITDGTWSSTGSRIVLHGGSAVNGSICGAFALGAGSGSSLASVALGGAVTF